MNNTLLHKHITVEEMAKARRIGNSKISPEDVDFLLELEEKAATCKACERRVSAFDAMTTLCGEGFFDQVADVEAVYEKDVFTAESQASFLKPAFARAAAIVDSIEDLAEKKHVTFREWFEGTQSVFAGFGQRYVYGLAGGATRGGEGESSVDGLAEFEILNAGEKLSIEIDKDYLEGVEPEFVVICGQDSDFVTIEDVVELDEYTVGTEAISLEPGAYTCWVACKNDGENRP